MLFSSLPFVVFLTIVFLVYWLLAGKSYKIQNLLLLAANYVFYAWWDWRFLYLLIAYGLGIFFIGHKICNAATDGAKKRWMALALTLGIGALCYFKYTNFFITTFSDALLRLGYHSSLYTLNIILPLGISFFTFQSLSYVLDIRNGKIKPTGDIIAFMTFVSFFPTVLSGPIERADNLLVQLQTQRKFDFSAASDGMRQILWGLFKKMVIADNLARVVDAVFTGYGNASSAALVAGMIIYPFQLYADFSGYSDMAIGIARLLGFNLVRNFAYPFFARNIPDFWRRWHMSLTNWITEYLYTPLTIALRHYGKAGLILSILITYTLIGFWHGANFTYIVFGVIHSTYFSIFLLRKKKKKKGAAQERELSLRNIALMVQTFLMVAFADLFFRADSVPQAIGYLARMCSGAKAADLGTYADLSLLLIPCMLVAEWRSRTQPHALAMSGRLQLPVRWALYTVLVLFIFFCGGQQQKFIYFQF